MDYVVCRFDDWTFICSLHCILTTLHLEFNCFEHAKMARKMEKTFKNSKQTNIIRSDQFGFGFHLIRVDSDSDVRSDSVG